mgnify:CR=1 FL=1
MTDKAGKKYGLILKKKPTSVQIKPSIFGGDDSGDEQDSGRKNVNTTIRKEAEKKKQIRQTQSEIDKVLEEDPTAFDYDAVYDKMAERKANLLAAKTAKADKKPKYIGNLLKFAEVRKKEEERRVERQVQKEREAEGNEFADKDAFVTSAFKKKMQEMAEEEERQRKRDERDGDVTKQADLSKFYRNLLDRNVSTGGSFDTEQHTETHEESTKKSRLSPSREKERGDDKKTERREQTSGSERKGRGYRESEDEKLRDRPGHRKDRGTDDERDERKRSSRDETERHKSRGEDNRTREKSRREHEKRHNEHEEQHHEKPRVEERDEADENEQQESRKRSNEGRSSDEILGNSEKPEANGTESKSEEKNKEEKTSAGNKFAKHSSNETVLSARERYLARKKNRVVVVQTGSDDEN